MLGISDHYKSSSNGAPAISFAVDPPIYFLHIPKTAGMSVTKWLAARVPAGAVCPLQLWDDLAAGRAGALAGYSVYHGHFGGNFEQLLGRRTRTITVLREPLARTLSHYKQVRRDATHLWHDRVGRQSFGEFVADPLNLPMIENFQARYLAGLPLDLAPLLAAADGPARRFGGLSVMLEELGHCLSPDWLRRAALQQLSGISVAGVTEALPDFLARVAGCFGFPHDAGETPPRENASGDWGTEIPAETAEAVARLTEVDRALYDHVAGASRGDGSGPAILIDPGDGPGPADR